MQVQNKVLLFKQYSNILGLTNNIEISDIKKSYRLLAKTNHPDKFKNKDEKLKQEKIMANITEAYKYIVKNYNELYKDESLTKTSKIKKNDYKLYKECLIYYNKYFDTFFKLFSKRELITPEEKKDCLIKAKLFYDKLMIDYPESVWISDVNDRLKKKLIML